MELVLAVVLGVLSGVSMAGLLWKLVLDKPTQDNSSMQRQVDALRQQVGASLGETQRTLREELHLLRSQVDNKMNDSHHLLSDRLGTTNQIIFEVQKSLGRLSTTTEQVIEISKDISSLQDLLRPPKLRGSLGELLLAELLAQVLATGQYTLQYRFQDGETVDAVIHLNSGLVPIDSKFPLENFEAIMASETEEERKTHHRKFATDVRKHVDAISSKYIRPNEGTFDFALMYIPAENIYYETIIKEETSNSNGIYTYALQKKVVPVSPNSFYAYLQAIALGLKGMCIEESAQDILRQIGGMSTEIGQIHREFDTLGLHLTNAAKKYGEVEKRLAARGRTPRPGEGEMTCSTPIK
jgi:DNA recombination protein RmuC